MPKSLELLKSRLKQMPKAQNPYIKINPLRVCPFFYDPCILPTSDAFKYLIYRSNFVSQYHSQFTGMNPSVV
jgi:hypothetical protein